MTEQFYRQVSAYFRAHPVLLQLLIAVNKALPYLIGALFFVCGCFLLVSDGIIKTAWYFGIPAVKFVLVSVIRACINAPRPYDVLDFEPLVRVEHGKGKSTPSRHTASAFAIARSLCLISPWLGGIGVILAVLVGICRVMTGCHFPKDVLLAIFFFI